MAGDTGLRDANESKISNIEKHEGRLRWITATS